MPASRVAAPIVLLIFLASCHRPTDKKQLLAINEGLIRSFSSIQDNTNSVYMLLLSRKSDPHTRLDADRWDPVALRSKEITEKVFEYIESVRLELDRSGQLSAENTKALFDSLLKYKNALAATLADSLDTAGHIMEETRQNFTRHFPLLRTLSDSIFNETRFNAWADTTFGKDPLITLLALNKLKIDIALSAKMIARYCDYRTQDETDHYTVFGSLININSSIVKPEEVIKITAGIGSFSVLAKPGITIAGNPVPLTASGIAFYEFKAPRRPGKYSIPIKLEYYKFDGSKTLNEQVVTYEVSALH
jgi:hypothetical protein